MAMEVSALPVADARGQVRVGNVCAAVGEAETAGRHEEELRSRLDYNGVMRVRVRVRMRVLVCACANVCVCVCVSVVCAC
jgi:hypothetical protein